MKKVVFGQEYDITPVSENFKAIAKRLFAACRYITPQNTRLVSDIELVSSLSRASSPEEAAVVNSLRAELHEQYSQFTSYLRSSMNKYELVILDVDNVVYLVSARQNKNGNFQVSFAPTDIPAEIPADATAEVDGF